LGEPNRLRGAPLAGGCTRPTPPPLPANRFRKETIVGNRFWGSLSHSPKGHDWRYVGPRPLGWGALGVRSGAVLSEGEHAIIPLSASQLHYNLVTKGGCRYGGPFTFWFAAMPRKEPQPPKEAPLLTWEIYLRARHRPNTSAGSKRLTPTRR
jgi:hypothetical protein